ncbi:hypothetical protein HPB47_020634 [Ixodes persulcatus]|uniref:Uncharacterized protein n=1 Tax=Ixodes persulcatus TaxID=34615 RepID=A0AC60QEU0_IXOPE|nr:hypothetical protein HPB47_020634 [Ixodes persulcatus]
MKRPPPAPLPKGDHKIVVRPRGGFNTASWPDIHILDGARSSIPADLPPARELLRKYPEQNIFVICTSNSERAEAYSKMQAMNIADKTYPATAYITTPENTCKGIIHGIPEEDTPETIWNSLQYNTNPPFCKSGDSGKADPCFSPTRANAFRTGWTTEERLSVACSTRRGWRYVRFASALGTERTSAPRPTTKNASPAAPSSPTTQTTSEPSLCVICGGGHESGSKRCRRRFLPARKPRAPLLPILDLTDQATFPAMDPVGFTLLLPVSRNDTAHRFNNT